MKKVFISLGLFVVVLITGFLIYIYVYLPGISCIDVLVSATNRITGTTKVFGSPCTVPFWYKDVNDYNPDQINLTAINQNNVDTQSIIGTTTAVNVKSINFETLLKNILYKEETASDVCMADQKPIYINSVKYFDFDGDGKDEAIVRASSCFTGTAGPDINSVYKLLPSGQVIQLTVNDNNGMFNGKKIYDHSWKDYGYDVKNNKLINIRPIYKDSDGNCCPSGGSREITYEWNGKEFMISGVIEVTHSNTVVPTVAKKVLNQPIANYALENTVGLILTSRECNYSYILERSYNKLDWQLVGTTTYNEFRKPRDESYKDCENSYMDNKVSTGTTELYYRYGLLDESGNVVIWSDIARVKVEQP